MHGAHHTIVEEMESRSVVLYSPRLLLLCPLSVACLLFSRRANATTLTLMWEGRRPWGAFSRACRCVSPLFARIGVAEINLPRSFYFFLLLLLLLLMPMLPFHSREVGSLFVFVADPPTTNSRWYSTC